MNRKPRTGYKLLRLRKDGSLGPLFINKCQRIPVGEWLVAEDHQTKGYAHRPGWHVLQRPVAPHLSARGRVWALVEVLDWEGHERPASQGGVWFLAKYMRVLEVLSDSFQREYAKYAWQPKS